MKISIPVIPDGIGDSNLSSARERKIQLQFMKAGFIYTGNSAIFLAAGSFFLPTLRLNQLPCKEQGTVIRPGRINPTADERTVNKFFVKRINLQSIMIIL
ncbi:MAG: hypothetical protein V5A81_01330 [Candidatus Bipolaricaulota bacterium]